MPIVIVEDDGIGGRAGPGAGWANGAGGEHGVSEFRPVAKRLP
jgi:hypothetical protein